MKYADGAPGHPTKGFPPQVGHRSDPPAEALGFMIPAAVGEMLAVTAAPGFLA